MDYRRIAGTDLDVSVLCYGPMRAAEKQPGDDARSREGERALQAAIDAGINFIHSSYEYGTRWMMNRVLRDHPRRHQLIHVIKVPVPDWDDEGRFDAGKMRLRVEEALRDLAAERIAVLQWMWRARPDEDRPRLAVLPGIMDDLVACFEQLRDEGKAGYLWNFPYSAPTARAALETGAFGGLVAYHNAIELDYLELFPDLARHGRGFIAIRPLAAGVLTDRRRSFESLPEGDRLKTGAFRAAFRKRAAVERAFAAEIGDSMTRFALRFPLYSDICASVVVGMNTEQQVRELAGMVDGVAPRPDLVERAAVLARDDFST